MSDKIPFVFSGSGSLLYAHVGAAQCMLDNNIEPSHLIGTSGGSIVASMLSNGITPKECVDISLEILPKNVMSFNWKMLFNGYWGLSSLDKLEKVLSKYVSKTFKDCKIPLYVVTTDLTSKRSRVFCKYNSPEMSVSKSVRISSSVPFLFNFVPFDNTILTDGGVVNNYPIDLVVPGNLNLRNMRAVGFRLLSKKEHNIIKPQNLFECALSVLNSLMSEVERKHIEDQNDWSKTITIELPFDSLSFIRVDKKTIKDMYDIGYNTVKKKMESGWLPSEVRNVIS